MASSVAANNCTPLTKGCFNVPQMPCPPQSVQDVLNAVLNWQLGDQVALGLSLAQQLNSVVQIGVNVSAAYMAGTGSPIGWGGSASETLAFDPSGNIALAISYGTGPTSGAGIIAGYQVSISPWAWSVMSLSGPSASRGASYADEYGGGADWSNNAGGTLSVVGGVGVGGMAAYNTQGPTTVTPLVCN
jgi:hypothetical protein